MIDTENEWLDMVSYNHISQWRGVGGGGGGGGGGGVSGGTTLILLATYCVLILSTYNINDSTINTLSYAQLSQI